MALIPALIVFTPGTKIKSAEANSNFDAVKTAFNNTAVLTDLARTITVAHTFNLGQTWVAAQSFPAGVVGNLTGNVTGTILTASQPNITSLGTLTSLVSTGGAVFTKPSGSAGSVLVVGVAGVANGLTVTNTAGNSLSLEFTTTLGAVFTVSNSGMVSAGGGFTGTILTAAQPNITSLGTVTGLVSSGVITITKPGAGDQGFISYVTGGSNRFAVGVNVNVANAYDIYAYAAGLSALSINWTSGVVSLYGGLTMAGGSITGNIAGNLTGSVLTAAQGNITSLGTLTSLRVSGGILHTGVSVSRFENTGGGPLAGAAGPGIDIWQTGIQSYNRTTLAYGPLSIDSSGVTFNASLVTPQNVQAGSFTWTSGAKLEPANDATAPRIQSYTSKTLYINELGNTVNIGGVTFPGAGALSGNLTGTIITAAQANITSLGTLTSITTSGSLFLQGTGPRTRFHDTDGTVNQRMMDFGYGGAQLDIEARDDGGAWVRTVMTLGHNGNVTVSGSVTAASYFTSSSRAVKEKIQPFTRSALELVNRLKIVGFRFREDPALPRVGFIAEDSDPIFTAGGKRFDLANTVAILAKAVQELSRGRELAACR